MIRFVMHFNQWSAYEKNAMSLNKVIVDLRTY